MPTDSKLDKVIVTNISALKAKYGADGVKKVKDAVNALIAADKKRGLVAQMIAIDDAAAMKAVSGKPVSKADDPRQNKDAIDAVYKALAPDYMMILGAIDVIPHQNLINPMFSIPNDIDRYAYGDLPYACESKYSQNPADFFGPTRVLGRLPDINGAKDPQYLINLLNLAAGYKSVDADKYRNYFGVSAEIWKGSTAMSLSNTFGNNAELKTVPPKKATWRTESLKSLSHFINCHGAPHNSAFYGQSEKNRDKFPVALEAAYLKAKVSEGTVIAAECCYGGQLFDPAKNGGQPGICNTYLANKAYGFFGSTTIAYGPSNGNDAADLLCQFFLQSMIKGASLGRAALEARQKFIHTASMSDPDNVKTIAQFNLYGDPSVTPVKSPRQVIAPMPKIYAGVLSETPAGVQDETDMRVKRAERRRDLFSRGAALAISQPVIKKSDENMKASLKDALAIKAAEHGMQLGNTLSFNIVEPKMSKSMHMGLMERAVFPTRVHVIFDEGRADAKMPMRSAEAAVHPSIVALIVKEADGKIVSVKKTYSR